MKYLCNFSTHYKYYTYYTILRVNYLIKLKISNYNYYTDKFTTILLQKINTANFLVNEII